MGRAHSSSWESKEQNIPCFSTISLMGLTQSEAKGCPTSGLEPGLAGKVSRPGLGEGGSQRLGKHKRDV